MQKTCIVIVGPTAVGKTVVAIQLAQQFNTEIISADSRQCFKELNIGVAKPSSKELASVQHHFINSHSIKDEVNTAVYEKYALQKAKQLFEKHDVVIVVGGTGLYIKTFCYGIDEVPVIDPTIRKKIADDHAWEGIDWLQGQIKEHDPLYFTKGEMKNPQRMMRALEVKLSTGRSIIEFHTQPKKKRDFNIIQIGLELPKEQLHKNINNRVDMMIGQGLLEEVRALLPYKDLNALQTVGYRELFGHLKGELLLQDAVEIIKINTRQYAKRQMTWFKKDESVNWMNADATALEKILEANAKAANLS